uniref:ApcF n=1 Tax=Griffithsia pacifica TaxID=35689 RepID=A0A291FE93_GRIPA|nr:ApcF [Griffithsia pacifica]5Y6P_Q1 Chain Q1, ApcF [Griffithsia pacifica]5Y6P_g1 Chain g1, ApcF [Griffithsia pacifica]
MQDTIASIVNRYDCTGKYLDNVAISELESYFSTAIIRLKVIELINQSSSKIIQEAANRLYTEQPELLRPGGNSYTTRRYSACLRDIEYYLRYASYALIAGNTTILSERVLDGLKETYSSLNVPIGPTVRSIQLLEDIICNEFIILAQKQNISTNITFIQQPFNYMVKYLSEKNI